MPRLHSGAASDRQEIIEIPKLPPITEVVWQQPSETSTDQFNLNNTKNDSIKYDVQKTSQATGATQTSPPKGIQPQN